jgi:desulfoferrodoxin (superoxide reductase-like protein)
LTVRDKNLDRASVCNWELEFYFRDEVQIRNFLKLLMEDEILFDFNTEKVLDNTDTLYYVNIKGTWANNLVRVAQLLSEVDYEMV